MTAATTLAFLGGVGTVTGSRFLLRSGTATVLVDCGLYQGLRALRRRNWEPFPVPPSGIDAVVLTHAHLDHCGYLPVLARDGFTGPIWCTQGTVELATIVLRDSAHLQEEDAAYARHAGYSKHDPPLPLYQGADAEQAIKLFRPIRFGTRTAIADGVEATLGRAGHILGSAHAHIEIGGRSAGFSGDLGRRVHPLLVGPDPPPAVGTMVVESTYGNRSHPAVDHDEVLADSVHATLDRGGVVLIPAFAVDRTEVLLMQLRQWMRSGVIPEVPVYVDSPMALAALAVYRRAIAADSPEIRPDLGHGGDPFDTGHLAEARTAAESQRLNRPSYPCIIVSASGMAAGGRVLHHLRYLAPDRRNLVLFAGYQAVGTRGRQLVDGATEVKIHGRYVPVHARVVAADDWSSHADASETIAWLARATEPPTTCYLVHGEPDAASALARRIRAELGWTTVLPEIGERVRLD